MKDLTLEELAEALTEVLEGISVLDFAHRDVLREAIMVLRKDRGLPVILDTLKALRENGDNTMYPLKKAADQVVFAQGRVAKARRRKEEQRKHEEKKRRQKEAKRVREARRRMEECREALSQDMLFFDVNQNMIHSDVGQDSRVLLPADQVCVVADDYRDVAKTYIKKDLDAIEEAASELVAFDARGPKILEAVQRLRTRTRGGE